MTETFWEQRHYSLELLYNELQQEFNALEIKATKDAVIVEKYFNSFQKNQESSFRRKKHFP